ncbi:rhomboid family intramembrane serine protease [Leptospira sp. GIMC2001]|uniref:rhomboid family intramembrane serine protease n=1 Tax=Leptospira sp. GIMC2001 TaxID=1513297 RepID=UPI00234A25A4|nr:rhomboid family intramembrane serine protease [Leptospira sp. GIMC2001]WCL48857.1 rhomboid family intramembrane serine protease [Leptospira sp. GIMC2001]
MPKKTTQLFGYPILHPINIILLFNCFVFIIQSFSSPFNPLEFGPLEKFFGLQPWKVMLGQYWQVFTYGFLHSTGGFLPIHLLFNMYAFYMLGSIMIPSIGKVKFVSLYFLSQLGGGLLVFSFALMNEYFFDNQNRLLDSFNSITIGASGSVFGLLAVFGFMFPEMEILIFFFRVQARNAVMILLVFGYGISYFFGEQIGIRISNTGHMGGAIAGVIFYFLFLKQQSGSFKIPALFKPRSQRKLESREPSQPKEVAPIIQKISIEDVFQSQVIANGKLLRSVAALPKKEREPYLLTVQVADANICPPIAYNSEDAICQRCEWLPNCALRKHREQE